MRQTYSETFCGQPVSKGNLSVIKEITDTFSSLTRTELANTICELFSWERPTGKLKTVECLQFLEHLDTKGIINLPEIKKRRPKGIKTKIQKTKQAEPQSTIFEKLSKLTPILLTKVESKKQRQLWYDYVERYHYLGYQLPFGAQLRYFIKAGGRDDEIIGCMQFSSPAWKMAPRDNWVGWKEEQRKRNLQKIINNSRFLLFPWVKVKNLASSVLALTARTVPEDWQRAYGYRPVLLETLVDQKRFKGTCYKAANWIHVGTTTGRGRMDRDNKRHGQAPKEIYVYPLYPGFRQTLCSG